MKQMDNLCPRLFREKILNRLPELRTSGEAKIPNQRFWDFYRANKDLFYQSCISVAKREDCWVIVAYEFVDRAAAYQAKIEAMLEKHYSVCPTCNVSPGICMSMQKNGRWQFQFYCPSCYDIYSSALPYLLVDHLEDEGIHICERELVYQHRDHDWGEAREI